MAPRRPAAQKPAAAQERPARALHAVPPAVPPPAVPPAVPPPVVLPSAAAAGPAPAGLAIATSRDESGAPIHHGWSPVATHHRWLEPFVLMALASGCAHGYAIVGLLTEIRITDASLDVGQVYRALRDLEQAGQVESIWTTGSGPARREYTITDVGSRALDEWAAVMKERHRLIGEFDGAYLAWLTRHPGPSLLP